MAAIDLIRAAQDVGLADEVGHEQRSRTVIEILSGPELLDPAHAEDRDPVAHHERLFLVVGHVQHGRPELAADPDDLELERLAQLAVQRAEWLVHQQEPRFEDDGTGECDALLLAA